jgi:hypothetical protein
MNFFVNTTSTDAALSSSLYPGLVDVNGINLKEEFRRILYGYGSTLPKGNWIVYRRFDRTSFSQYYDPVTREGVGGPKYNATNEIFKVRKIPNPRTDTDLEIKAGITISDKFVYYVESHIQPKLLDEIFEINLVDHSSNVAPRYEDVELIERYIIERVHPYRLENGVIQYWAVVCTFNNIKY